MESPPDSSQANPPPENPAVPSVTHSDTLPRNILTDEEYKEALKIPVTQKGSYIAALLLTASIVPLPFILIIITATIYITGLIPSSLGPVTANLTVLLVSLGITLFRPGLWIQ